MDGYNFTEDVRRVLARAREEAVGLHHGYVGPEHILLSLTHDERVARLLADMSAAPDAIRADVEALLGRGTSTAGSEALPYSSRAKKVIELTMVEARELQHDYVETDHVLLALLRERDGVAAQVLTQRGMTLDATRAEVVRRLPSLSHDREVGATPEERATRLRARMATARNNRILFRAAAIWSWVVSIVFYWSDSLNETWLRRMLPPVRPRFMLDLAVLPTFLFGFAFWSLSRDSTRNRGIVALAAAGTLLTFAALVYRYSTGDFPGALMPLAFVDLAFGILFLRFLLRGRV